jgi:hypothetical protein
MLFFLPATYAGRVFHPPSVREGEIIVPNA